MTPRDFVKANPTAFPFVFGIISSISLYAIGAYEACVLFAVFMPGVYWGFAYIAGDWLELMEETVTLAVLIGVFQYCLHQIYDHSMYYCGPLAIGIHGLVDLLHHFKLYPSSKHVHTCAPEYPLMCALFDLTTCGTMCLLIYLSSSQS